MSDRTYGETRNCAGCRFWSEMIAQAIGGGPVTAMCLVESGRYAGKYTAGFNRCDSWKSGHYGAVDDPPDYGAEVRAMYAEEDAVRDELAGKKQKSADAVARGDRRTCG